MASSLSTRLKLRQQPASPGSPSSPSTHNRRRRSGRDKGLEVSPWWHRWQRWQRRCQLLAAVGNSCAEPSVEGILCRSAHVLSSTRSSDFGQQCRPAVLVSKAACRQNTIVQPAGFTRAAAGIDAARGWHGAACLWPLGPTLQWCSAAPVVPGVGRGSPQLTMPHPPGSKHACCTLSAGIRPAF